MEVLNYSELRKNLKATLDSVIDDRETVIINRGNKKNVVIISLDEFNSWSETNHLLGTENNRKRLEESIKQDKEGMSNFHKLIED
jgi:antitoxin YefM